MEDPDSFLKKFEKNNLMNTAASTTESNSTSKHISKVSNKHSFAKCAHLRLRHNDFFTEVIYCCYC